MSRRPSPRRCSDTSARTAAATSDTAGPWAAVAATAVATGT